MYVKILDGEISIKILHKSRHFGWWGKLGTMRKSCEVFSIMMYTWISFLEINIVAPQNHHLCTVVLLKTMSMTDMICCEEKVVCDFSGVRSYSCFECQRKVCVCVNSVVRLQEHECDPHGNRISTALCGYTRSPTQMTREAKGIYALMFPFEVAEIWSKMIITDSSDNFTLKYVIFQKPAKSSSFQTLQTLVMCCLLDHKHCLM